MKKSILGIMLISFGIALPITTNAQIGAKLNNLKDKVGGKKDADSSDGSTSDKPAKESREDRLKREDMETDFLNKREFKQDSKGISGIYYTTSPILAMNDMQNSTKSISKVLIEYREDPANRGNTTMKISNRFSFEENDRSKLVQAIVYSSGSVPTSLTLDINERSGHTCFFNMNYVPYTSIAGKYEYNAQSEMKFVSLTYMSMPNHIYEAEPGIFIVHSQPDKDRKESVMKNVPLLVFYKEGLKEKADLYSGSEGYAKVDEIIAKQRAASDDLERGSVTLMKPIPAFKDEPTRATLEAAMKVRMAREGWKEELVYVYPGSQWSNQFELLGLLAQNTLVKRILTAQAVFKMNGKYKVAQIQYQQDNTFTTGSLTENFKGNEVYVLGVASLWNADEKVALQYKK